MFTYSQSTGEFSHDGEKLGVGYSGSGQGKNNPAMQDIHEVGPIPQGQYEIGPIVLQMPGLGPLVFALYPKTGLTDTFGRSGFYIHGDSIEHPGRASHGCIVLDRQTRMLINSTVDFTNAKARDADLTVTP